MLVVACQLLAHVTTTCITVMHLFVLVICCWTCSTTIMQLLCDRQLGLDTGVLTRQPLLQPPSLPPD